MDSLQQTGSPLTMETKVKSEYQNGLHILNQNHKNDLRGSVILSKAAHHL